MSKAFRSRLNTEWNEEVIEYLASQFNSTTPRIMEPSNSVFINATLIKFDDVSFMIIAADDFLELSFAKVDTDKIEPIIQKILEWDAFSKHSSRFYVKVDDDTTHSILFVSGQYYSPHYYTSRFYRHKTEVVRLKNK